MLTCSNLLDLLRVKQWIKNAFVFFPILFAGRLWDGNLLQENLITLLAFCLLSSATYIFNDLCDLSADRAHPEKAKRPLASNRVSPSHAIIIGIFLLTAGLLTAWSVGPMILVLGAAYSLLNGLYSLLLKKFVIIDVLSIALGFHIRIWAGSLAVGVTPSIWLQGCTFLLTLFLGFTKRRHELSLLNTSALEHREVFSRYTIKLLDKIIFVCSALALIFYALYAFYFDGLPRAGHHTMLYSVVFVFYGIFRYLHLIYVKKLGDDPGEVLFTDRPLLICVTLWVASIFWILYGAQAS